MIESVEYRLNRASESEIADHLLCCDVDFVPPLSGRVGITDYAQKIARKATKFEAWSNCTLVGLVAVYCNDHESRIAYVTNVSVLKAWNGKGIAARLMEQCIEYVEALGMWQISLEVASDNTPAIRLYEKSGFVVEKADTSSVTMNLYLESREEHEQQA